MAKRQSIAILGETFASKAALQRRVQPLLKTLGPVPVSEVPFLLAFFERHPTAEQKIGPGIAAIWVAPAGDYATNCFHIRRTDGTETHLSYKECITPTTPAQWFRMAARTAIVPQQQAAKDLAFAASDTIACPITGESITRETSHADHEPPSTFFAIAAAFLAETGTDPSAVEYEDADSTVESRFVDDSLASRFAEFHRARASLRVVSIKANLSTLRRKPKETP